MLEIEQGRKEKKTSPKKKIENGERMPQSVGVWPFKCRFAK